MNRARRLTFNLELINNPARRAALFAAARKQNPAVDGYVGSDKAGNHYMQATGNSTPVIILSGASDE